MTVGIVKHPIYLKHLTDEYHPESPKRLEHVYAMLETLDQQGLAYVSPRMATPEEIALVHDLPYIESIARAGGKPMHHLDPDTVSSPKTYEAALMAVGGLLQLADAIQSSEVDTGFALVRPPGHHAERSHAMGFCIFNNIAIAAKYLENKYGLKNILLVDFDLHHGNGTQHTFYQDRTVLYFSTHQYPYYPGTGSLDEVGEGDGRGYTINVPMSGGMGDEDYIYAFKDVLVPVSEMYKPEMVLVSAGFDTYYDDPLGGMAVTETGFAAMTRILLDIAKKHCNGQALFALEGGYDLRGLASSVRAVIAELMGKPLYPYEKKAQPSPAIVQTATALKRTLIPYWGHF
ncbi:MAG TPA: histone deacetylase [Syntrophorhabdaceae bacterium]|nr:histone deacetylase [Syntrophorhabdaceae bacterium]